MVLTRKEFDAIKSNWQRGDMTPPGIVGDLLEAIETAWARISELEKERAEHQPK